MRSPSSRHPISASRKLLSGAMEAVCKVARSRVAKKKARKSKRRHVFLLKENFNTLNSHCMENANRDSVSHRRIAAFSEKKMVSAILCEGENDMQA
ncbi:hypothetical protein CDAR_593641 [Caerostris darwini]|uniref:Uncharacterized protein n=1 Tax=Caerostris darwini TaxID=1538125 RepID=A0AAV4S264_9ARAC|nr:hypothetical protein CDAR_593641 [Caerostris darwini]